jgi:hypothetical protein
MWLKTSSLTISSYELSSGMSWTIATTVSFALRSTFGMAHSIANTARASAEPIGRRSSRVVTEPHGPVYWTTNKPPLMSLTRMRFEAGKM